MVKVDFSQAVEQLSHFIEAVESGEVSYDPEYMEVFLFMFWEPGSDTVCVFLTDPFHYRAAAEAAEVWGLEDCVRWLIPWGMDYGKLREKLQSWGDRFVEIARGYHRVRRGDGSWSFWLDGAARDVWHQIEEELISLHGEWLKRREKKEREDLEEDEAK